MKISYNWLSNYIELQGTPENTADVLTDIGLEVEKLEQLDSVKGGLEGLVIGEILSTDQHPNADRLKLTKVDVGEEEPLSIVCGAPNVEVGQKVVVAKVGTTIYPMNGDSFTIKKAKIRGEESRGMICAEDEIGLGEGHDGIMVLDVSAPIGMDAASYFKVEKDHAIEIGLTPNRADAASHIGVARDLLAKYQLDGSSHVLSWPDVSNFEEGSGKIIDVIVEDNEACPRYTGLTITNVKVEDSPQWLKSKLNAIGLKPINNVVDITNFVLHELGQPLHAFDADQITGDKVIVKKLSEGTEFITLDEEKRKLSSEDLMICNAQEGMCIAGVFGGIKSGVTESTTSIFLESAYFNPVSVRKTAKRHALNTDASFRFERGVDPNITVYALKRAALLICEVAGGKVSSPVFDSHPEPFEPFVIDFAYAQCDKLIGEVIPRETIKKIVTSLEMKILSESEDGLKLAVPAFKVDVQREADVIEEVLRVYGYNNIALPAGMSMSYAHSEGVNEEKLRNIVCDMLTGNGFLEIMSNSLTTSSYYDENDELVKILNPLSAELDVMRQQLLYNGLEAIGYNLNRRENDLRLYELGHVYQTKGNKYKEEMHLGLFLTGKKESERWNARSEDLDFFTLKKYINLILERIGFDLLAIDARESNSTSFAYGLSYFLKDGRQLVELGATNKGLLRKIDIKENVFHAIVNWDVLVNALPKMADKITEIPKFPSVRRDLALLLDKNVEFGSLEQLAYKTETEILQKVDLFDVYEGNKIDSGKKSYALSFILRDDNKTLTDKRVDKTMSRLIQAFEKELGATIR